MPTQNLIQRQNEIIQRSQSIINDYERRKSDAEARLKRDKETAEHWKRTRAASDSAIQFVHEAMRSAQEVLKRTRWQDKLVGGTPPVYLVGDRQEGEGWKVEICELPQILGLLANVRLLRNKVLQGGVCIRGSTSHIAVLCG